MCKSSQGEAEVFRGVDLKQKVYHLSYPSDIHLVVVFVILVISFSFLFLFFPCVMCFVFCFCLSLSRRFFFNYSTLYSLSVDA